MIEKAYLEITNRCNLSCSFCHGTGRLPRTMTEEEFEHLTDRLAGEVQYLYFHLMGEPFLHPLLPLFVKRAREKGFRPMLTTNGTLLCERGEAVLAARPYKISISLHAPRANTAFCAPDYLSHCITFAKRSAAAGVITVLRLWNIGGADGGNEEILSALHRAFEGEWGAIRSGYRMAPLVFLEWGEHFDWPDPKAPATPADTPLFCHGLRNQIGVLCDGTVVPCCLDADGHLALGNLFSTPLADLLASRRAKAIYDGFTVHRAAEELCRRCGFARRFCR